MTNGIATTNHKIYSRVVSASQTTTIPGHTIQLLTVSLPTEVKRMDFSSVLIEPQGPTSHHYTSQWHERSLLLTVIVLQSYKL